MKFPPSHPFALYTPGTYQGKPSQYTDFIGDLVRAQIEQGGVPVPVYRFRGTPEQHKNAVGLDQNGKKDVASVGTFMQIQDTILLETRDRLYEIDDIPILHGVYQVSQFELEYAKWGGMLSNDAITMEFHVRSMETQLGRRLIEGDVVELPHLKDVTLDGRIQRKLYEISRVMFSPSGYDPTYGRHIMGAVLRPLKHQQEFLQIMGMRDEYGKTLAEQNSNQQVLMDITAANQQLAGSIAKTTGFDRSLMWIDPNSPNAKPDLYSDDLTPPDGSVDVGQGATFPSAVAEGTWFIRTDMVPARLYRFANRRWQVQRIDHKREWLPYNWVEMAREFMSDRSTKDRSRPYELRNIHDVITEREQQSDPTSDEAEKKKRGFKP